MRPLYEINADYDRLTWECETYALENGGELPPTLEEELNSITMERNLKIRTLGLWIKNMDSYDEALTVEIRKLEKRRKPIRNLSEKIRQLLSNTLSEGEKYKDGSVMISWRASTRTIITNRDLVPDLYIRREETVLLEEIKKDLKAGAIFEFAELQENKNIQIK